MADDPSSTPAQQIRTTASDLAEIADAVEAGEADRADLDDVIGRLRATAVREFGPRKRASAGDGASLRILIYLKDHVGEWVHGEELAAVSGIQEWARRTREWRVQHGYSIDEKAGSYRLNDTEPDVERAKRWRLANEIRRRPGSASERLLAFLKENEGRVVTRDELDYVGKIKEASRRVRELRDEQGWPIESHIDDREMSPGQYRLASASEEDRLDVRQRNYPEGVREEVFVRDNYTCQKCGKDRQKAERSGDSRFYLELHHVSAVAEQLDAMPAEELNDPENLITYCHRDHLEETAKLQKRRREERGSG